MNDFGADNWFLIVRHGGDKMVNVTGALDFGQ